MKETILQHMARIARYQQAKNGINEVSEVDFTGVVALDCETNCKNEATEVINEVVEHYHYIETFLQDN